VNANVEPLRSHKEHPVKTQWAPALGLLVLAPLCGELLSSSMPPAEWLNPVGVALVVILYGGGAGRQRPPDGHRGRASPGACILRRPW